MESILKKLYEGILYPPEEVIPQPPEYQEACKKLTNMLIQWEEQLPHEQFAYFEENFLQLQTKISAIENTETFIYGVKFGAALILELFPQTET